MTIQTTAFEVLYEGTGFTFIFPFSFQVPNGLYLEVTYTDAIGNSTVLSPSLYSVSFNANFIGGSVTYPLVGSDIAVGTTLLISRNVPLLQQTSLGNQANYSPTAVEAALDALCMEIQQVAGGAFGLALTFPPTDVSPQTVLPTAPLRAGKYLAFDGSGNPIVIAGTAVGGDVSGSTVLSTGSTTARSLAKRFTDVMNVKDFGAVGDGTTNDATAIQAGENYLASVGGGTLYFPPGLYAIGTTITKRASNVLWTGSGWGALADIGPRSYSSALAWIGAGGGTMVDMSPTAGASNQRISGGGIVQLGFYGGGSAAIGVSVKSVCVAKFEIYVDGFTTTGLYCGVVATLGEARDTQNNTFRVFLGQGFVNGDGVRLDGDSGANTSINLFHQIDGQYLNGTAIKLINADNNQFQITRTFRLPGGTGLGVDMLGGPSTSARSRDNLFINLSPGTGGVTVRGTEAYAVASIGNIILAYDNGNSAPTPIIGTAAGLKWSDYTGTWFAPDALPNWLFSGTTMGIRVYTGAGGSVIEGVDKTGVGSFQSLTVGGSSVTMTISGVVVGTWAAVNGSYLAQAARTQHAQGAVVASANNVTLGNDGNRFQISGTTQINLINNGGWQGGAIVVLHFQGIVVVKHNQVASGNNKPIFLAGVADLTTAAKTQLTLQYDSTDSTWYQI